MTAPSLITLGPPLVVLLGGLVGLAAVLGCVPADPDPPHPGGAAPGGDGDADEDEGGDGGDFAGARAAMVEHQLRARDIDDPRVLEAMARVPRHEFVPDRLRDSAYEDRPLPIGLDQTISQPYIVALMTQLVRPGPGDRALDIGTGSGYQAAVLAGLVDEVFAIEIHRELADSARDRLARLGVDNVAVRHGDGFRGWPEEAPFDLIIVAAAPAEVPPPLIEQLSPGGRLVIPVGEGFGQQLVLIERRADGSVDRRTISPVSFVPMTGEAERARPPGP